MNSLSWLIYFIGVVDATNTFALWLAIPSTIGLLAVITIWLCLNGVEVSNADNMSESDRKEINVAWHWWSKGKNIMLSAWLIGWFMIIFIPSRQTLLLIAGSEMAETVIKSDAVKDVVNPGMDLLKTWIKEETDRLKPKPESDK